MSAKRRRRRSRSRKDRGFDKLHIVLAAVGVIAVILIVWFGTDRAIGIVRTPKIENTVNELEYSLENMDLDALLNVVHPELADPIRLTLALANTNSNEVMNKLLNTMGVSNDIVGYMGDSVRKFDMEIRDIHASSKEATVQTLCTLDINGSEFFRYVTVYLEYLNEDWYVSFFTMQLTEPVG